MRRALASAALLLALIGVVVIASRGSNGPVGRWIGMPSSPLSARTSTVSVWDGSELLVWGGISGGEDACSAIGSCRPPHPTGAAFRPTSQTWRVLPTGPLDRDDLSGECSGAWDGEALLIVCDGGTAAFNPRSWQWKRVATNPVQSDYNSIVVWDGHELLDVGGNDGSQHGAPTSRGAAYDPTTDRWRLLAPMPFARSGSAAVWDGDQLLVWGGSSVASNYHLQVHNDGAAFNPSTNQWQALPTSPLAGRYDATAIWTGDRMFIWGGVGLPEPFGDGATFDPSTGRWSMLSSGPLTPRAGPIPFMAGRSVVLWGSGEAFGRPGSDSGAEYNLTSRQWTPMTSNRLPHRAGAAEAWTGRRLLVWGGGTCDGSACTSRQDGAIFIQ